MTISKALYTSDSSEWETPQDLFDRLNGEFEFALDPCATPENAKCEQYFTKLHPHGYIRPGDGLSSPWEGNAFVNPPYGEPEQPCKPKCKKQICQKRGWHAEEYIPGVIDWVAKAKYEANLRLTTNVMLLPGRIDTGWYHKYIWDGLTHKPQTGVEVRHLKGRLKFGGAANSAPFPSMIVIFRGA